MLISLPRSRPCCQVITSRCWAACSLTLRTSCGTAMNRMFSQWLIVPSWKRRFWLVRSTMRNSSNLQREASYSTHTHPRIQQSDQKSCIFKDCGHIKKAGQHQMWVVKCGAVQRITELYVWISSDWCHQTYSTRSLETHVLLSLLSRKLILKGMMFYPCKDLLINIRN